MYINKKYGNRLNVSSEWSIWHTLLGHPCEMYTFCMANVMQMSYFKMWVNKWTNFSKQGHNGSIWHTFLVHHVGQFYISWEKGWNIVSIFMDCLSHIDTVLKKGQTMSNRSTHGSTIIMCVYWTHYMTLKLEKCVCNI